MPARILFNREASYTDRFMHTYDIVDGQDQLQGRLRINSDGSLFYGGEKGTQLDVDEVVSLLGTLVLQAKR